MTVPQVGLFLKGFNALDIKQTVSACTIIITQIFQVHFYEWHKVSGWPPGPTGPWTLALEAPLMHARLPYLVSRHGACMSYFHNLLLLDLKLLRRLNMVFQRQNFLAFGLGIPINSAYAVPFAPSPSPLPTTLSCFPTLPLPLGWVTTPSGGLLRWLLPHSSLFTAGSPY